MIVARVLLVGFDDACAARVRRRLAAVSVQVVARAGHDEIDVRALSDRSPVVIDLTAGDAAALGLVRTIRSKPELTDLPIICCLSRSERGDLPARLVDDLGVRVLLYQPIEPEELAQQAASLLGVALPPLVEDAGQRPVAATIVSLWDQLKGPIVERTAIFDEVSAALRADRLGGELRRSARAEAHKLTGTVGTVGFFKAAQLARQLDDLLRPGAPLGRADAAAIEGLTVDLRLELEQVPVQADGGRPASDGRPLLLIVDDDLELVRRVSAEAARSGMRVATATELPEARAAIARACPDLVLLDLTFPDETEDGLALLSELSDRTPPVPVLVLTARDGLADRVDVARRGGRGFLQKPVPVTPVVEAIINLLTWLRASEAKVLAVDDDPEILDLLRALVEPQRIRLTTLADPLRFWDVLEDASPDLLVLDVDMPHLSGIELCRVVRNDPRWGGLPILFLTARTDAETVQRLFAAGADDYVSKPIIGTELVTRFRNRLERTQLLRAMSETDPLTGVANRRKATQSIDQLLRLANRHRQPFSLALIDLDRFKQINDRHGHATGDTVLRRLGELLLRRFRGDDVVARWGGEEFLVGMYGMTRSDGVIRLQEALDQFGEEEFPAPSSARFSVTFSAGVAEYPVDGADLTALYQAADRAMYRAKQAGRDRVLPAGRYPDQEHGEPA